MTQANENEFHSIAAVVLTLTALSGCGDTSYSFNALSSPTRLPPISESASTALYAAATCNVLVGSGSGTVRIDSSIVSSAQVVCIRAGTYDGIDVVGINSIGNPIVVQNQGLVEVVGNFNRIYLENLNNVVFLGAGTAGTDYGIVVRDNTYRGLSFAGKITHSVLQNVSFSNVQDYVVSWDRPGTPVAYDGTPDSAQFYQNRLLRLKFENTAKPIILGSGDQSKLENIVLNVEVAYTIINNVPNAGSLIELNNGAFGVNVHHNTITNANLSLVGHPGSIFLNGDGLIHHNYIKTTIGNGVRLWPYSLGTPSLPGQAVISNNIFLDSHKYGAFEVQPFDANLNVRGMTTFTDVSIFHNTAGDVNTGASLPAGVNTWTAGLVDLYTGNGGRLDIQNNLLFNVTDPRDSSDPFINGQGSGWAASLFSYRNNRYYTSYSAAGLTSVSNPKPASSSTGIVGQGRYLSTVPTDFYGMTRANPPDLGAIEH